MNCRQRQRQTQKQRYSNVESHNSAVRMSSLLWQDTFTKICYAASATCNVVAYVWFASINMNVSITHFHVLRHFHPSLLHAQPVFPENFSQKALHPIFSTQKNVQCLAHQTIQIVCENRQNNMKFFPVNRNTITFRASRMHFLINIDEHFAKQNVIHCTDAQ